MKKILISAYAVSPQRGSECAVGWEITTRLAQYYEVTVLMCKVTPSGNKYFEEVETYIKNNTTSPNIKFVPIAMPISSKKYTKIHDLGFWPAYYWGYRCWQKEAYRVAADLNKSTPFDLAYQLNMIGFREPGYLWKLDIPFVWGPTNGFHSIPFSFLKSFKGKEFFVQTLKHIANEVQIKLAFRAKRAARKASLVWCVDAVTQKKIKEWGAITDMLQETGLGLKNDIIHNKKSKFDDQKPLKLVWSGMITSGKALGILIDALLMNKDLNFSLVVLGDGPLLQEMKNRAQSINHKIEWKGWLTKEDANYFMNSADLMIHTSLKEGTSNVILEALGFGIPVICHDTCGMGIVVNDKNGFKIPYKDFETSTVFVSELLKSIFYNPQILNDKYETIMQNSSMLSWDNKVKYIAQKMDAIIVEKNKTDYIESV